MDDQSQDDSENVKKKVATTSSTAKSGKSIQQDDVVSNVDLTFNPSPEVLFLIKSHAKTISAINKISKKLEQLEVKVCDISKQSSHSVSETTKCNAIDSKCLHSCAAHVLSDDSGGEYSRSTTNGTATDEDELMSLLDQIGKCSQSIRDTRTQVVNNQSSLSRATADPHLDVHHHLQFQTQAQHGNNNQRLTSASGHLQTKSALYEGVVGAGSGPLRSSPAVNQHQSSSSSIGVSPTVHQHHQQPFNPSHHVSWNQRPHHLHTSPSNSTSSSTIHNSNAPSHSASSLNALLFDPNVSRILNSLSDELITDDPNKFLFGLGPNHAETQHSVIQNAYHHHHMPLTGNVIVPGPSRPVFQRSLPTSSNNHQHYQHLSSHDLNHIPASIATSTPVSSDRGRRKWEMDRALQLAQKRAQDTVEVHYDMADQWLARQMNSKSQNAIPVTSSSPSQGSSVSTVTLRSPSSATSVKMSSQIPSTTGVSGRAGQKVTINSTHPPQIQVTGNNSSGSQLSSSTDTRHPIVNGSSVNHSRQQNVRSYHLSPPSATTSDSSQSGLKGAPSSSSSSSTVADVGSSLRKLASTSSSSRYNNGNNNNNNLISKR